MAENFIYKIDGCITSIQCKKCNQDIAVFGPAGSLEEMEKQENEHNRVCLDKLLDTQSESQD